jgi:hypothetical protein
MARIVRLAPYGTAGRFFGVIAAAAGNIACGVTLSGSSTSAGTAVGSLSVASVFTGAAAPIASGQGFILARGITDAGVGASVVASTGSISAAVSFAAPTSAQRTRLSAYGIASRFFATPNKTGVTQRNWAVLEAAGLNIGISDFDSRTFFLVDSFGLNLSPTAFYGASQGLILATATLTGVGNSTSAQPGSIEATVTFGGVGANVIVNSGDGSIEAVATFDGQGATAGTVFGVGVGSLNATATVTGGGASNVATPGSIESAAAFTGIGGPVFGAAGAIASTVTFAGLSTIPIAGDGSIAATVAFSGLTTSAAAGSGFIDSRVTFTGIVPGNLAPIPVRITSIVIDAPTIDIDITVPGISIVIS